jgi:hypothetical protein
MTEVKVELLELAIVRLKILVGIDPPLQPRRSDLAMVHLPIYPSLD